MKSPFRARARIGVLVPFTNTNLEQDMQMLCPVGIALLVTRMAGYEQDAVPDAEQMAAFGAADIEEPLRLLMGSRPDVVLYGCTSATLTHGPAFDRGLADRIRTLGGVATVTAAGSLIHALKSLGVQRIGFASPYVKKINRDAISFLADSGFETVSQAEVAEILDNTGQGAMTPEQVFELGVQADSKAAEALVLSCTDMRSVEVIAELEAKLNKPVVTSNQAMMFQAMGFLGFDDRIEGFGRLFAMKTHSSEGTQKL